MEKQDKDAAFFAWIRHVFIKFAQVRMHTRILLINCKAASNEKVIKQAVNSQLAR